MKKLAVVDTIDPIVGSCDSIYSNGTSSHLNLESYHVRDHRSILHGTVHSRYTGRFGFHTLDSRYIAGALYIAHLEV